MTETTPAFSKTPLTALGLLCLGLLLGAPSARATLGETGDTVDRDRIALKGRERQSEKRANYSIETFKTSRGTVKEFVTPSGSVFAIAWSGTSHPNVDPVLGSYSAKFHDGIRKHSRRAGRRHQKLRFTNMLVERYGHMRQVNGRVIDSTMLPPGVSENEIR